MRHEGDAVAALASAPHRHEATYVFPFQAHAPLETITLDSDAAPGGFGEHPVPPVALAVANAVFNATGRRARSLPLA